MPKKQERLKRQKEITEFNFKNKKSTQLGELESLSDDYTDFSMRCGESGITEFGEDRADLMGFNN